MYLREEPARLWAVLRVVSLLLWNSNGTEVQLKMLIVHPTVLSYSPISCEHSSLVCYLQHCLKPQVNDSWRQAEVHLWDKHAMLKGQRNGGRMGACDHGDRDNWGVRGGEVFPASWLYGPVSSRHTRISVPHNDHTHTHEFHRFGGRNRQTSRGEKTCLLCKPFTVWAMVTANQITQQQPRKLKEGGKKNLTYTEMMILRILNESWLPKSTLI